MVGSPGLGQSNGAPTVTNNGGVGEKSKRDSGSGGGVAGGVGDRDTTTGET